MSTKDSVVDVSIESIRPYEKNPRRNEKAIAKVAESIKAFGFLQPIVCDADGVILAGHTRYAAARSLGLKTVPVLYARDLTDAEAREYRIADNRVGELARWDTDLLSAELEGIRLDDPAFMPKLFGFDTSDREHSKYQWKHITKACDLGKKIQTHPKIGMYVTTLFASGKKGRPLEDIKADPGMVLPFAETATEYLVSVYGDCFRNGDWCVCTTPRRRHKTGFHFSTEVSRKIAGLLGIPFHADAVLAHNRDRIFTEFSLGDDPPQKNIILYDDIISTGVTMRDTRSILIDAGHVVLPIISIKNFS